MNPSILAYTQPVPPRMPTTYYSGPLLTTASPDTSGPHRILLAAAVVLIIVILYYMTSPRALARGLSRRGWTVYLREGCGYCREQMKPLGGFGNYILYGPDGALLGGCTKTPALDFNRIDAFPYWYNPRTGERRVGLQDAGALEKMTQR